jgi:predicted ATP-dependent endonuclease of OLD family
MKLVCFRITNYRSINDSGIVEINKRTVLVGRNESGKTNLLLALNSVNPSNELKELTFVKDFPRNRHRNEFSDQLMIVDTIWELGCDEKKEIKNFFSRMNDEVKISVKRPYKVEQIVDFIDLPQLRINESLFQQRVKSLKRSIWGSLRNQAEAKNLIKEALKDFEDIINNTSKESITSWAETVKNAINTFTQSITSQRFTMQEAAIEAVHVMQIELENIINDERGQEEAKKWVLRKLPKFIYLADYPELEGHQNIPEYLDRKSKNQLTEADINFEKLYKVAGLDPDELNTLLVSDHEQRQQLANRAGAVITQKIRELWTDRELTIRFNLDGNHFDTIISDRTSYYDVEVNLNERSRGFKWFLSFYITFAADTTGGPADNAILLLDDPGLHLHAVAQRNLLDHFAEDFDNQIIFTTHSPFMIPVDDLASIRTVNISQETGTTVTNDPTGDQRTLFPIQTALGYDLTQTLFIGNNNLVVEGVSDYWYLSSISEYLNEKNNSGLQPELVITPTGGAQKVSYMVALLTSHNLKVLVLLDDEKKAKNTAEELIKSKLIREQNVVFTSDGLSNPPLGGADIEDLIDPKTYNFLVNETYRDELQGKTLNINQKIPRIVKRYAEAFKELGVEFYKTRPAKFFLRQIVENPDNVMTQGTVETFERLFGIITKRINVQLYKTNGPFR